MADSGDITALLTEWRNGDEASLAKLIPIVYKELRRLAAQHMRREREGHTLETTALVHEAYLKLAGGQPRDWQNRAHFFGVAAHIMRTLLVDYARAGNRVKRGGGERRVALDEKLSLAAPDPEALLAVDQALTRLSEMDPRAGRVVELRYFGGLNVEEIASVMNISEKTVKRDWNLARTWLQGELRGGKTE